MGNGYFYGNTNGSNYAFYDTNVNSVRGVDYNLDTGSSSLSANAVSFSGLVSLPATAADKNVLVTGGAGVVAQYAIQLAKWAGAAKVVTTVSSETKAAHARAAGADVVINYRSENVIDRVRAACGGVDRIVDVDFGRNLPVSKEIINPFGGITCYASTGVKEPAFPYNDLLRLNVSVRPVFVYTMSDEAKRQAHADIARWLAATKPRFTIAERYALQDVVAAHLAVERGEKIGHVILTID